jgi:hypothetical protein
MKLAWDMHFQKSTNMLTIDDKVVKDSIMCLSSLFRLKFNHVSHGLEYLANGGNFGTKHA